MSFSPEVLSELVAVNSNTDNSSSVNASKYSFYVRVRTVPAWNFLPIVAISTNSLGAFKVEVNSAPCAPLPNHCTCKGIMEIEETLKKCFARAYRNRKDDFRHSKLRQNTCANNELKFFQC